MSAMSRTSRGEEVFVSFELVEPPRISVLTVDWPRASPTPTQRSTANVIAAHRDVVLFTITIPPFHRLFELFVYQAISRDVDDPSRCQRPSLLLLPPAAGTVCIMSFTSNDVVDNSPPSSFVVAELQVTTEGKSIARLFRSGSGQWEAFVKLRVRGAIGGDKLRWWSTDAVLPYYGRRYMIWADYYRGLVIMDLSSETKNPPPPPRLWYVPLPVDRVGNPVDRYCCRIDPGAWRSVSVTRYGIKFVSVDTQHRSNFRVGHLLKWSQRFRITTWSLCEDTYSWKKDLTMHEEEFWDAFDGGDRFPFPHVQPGCPVFDVDNPDVVVFWLQNEYWDRDEPRWKIEVDLRKKVLLAATVYSKES